ncbi:MAG: O-antigen ligase family protein [bacterium]|nr:O-antigen ligase family protein [bacterium]
MRNALGTALPARLDTALLYVFVVASVFVAGRLFQIVGPSASGIGFGAVAITVIAAAALRFLKFDIPVMAPFALTFGFFALSLYIFAGNFSREVNLNAIGPFIGIMSFVVYYPFIVRGKISTVTKTILLFSTVYAALYLILNITYLSGLMVPNLGSLVIPDAPGGRADRILAASAVLTVGASMWLVRARSHLTPLNIAMLILFLVDIYLTGSRYYQAVFVLLSIIYIITGRARTCGYIAISLFVLGASQMIISALFDLKNPFEIFGGDNSATVRAASVSLAVPHIREHWLMGVGFPSSDLDNVWAMSTKYFFSSDLGALGIMYNYGLVGLLLFGLLSYFSALPERRIAATPDTALDAQAITLTGAICALQGLIAPVLWIGSGTFLSGLFLAIALVYFARRHAAKTYTVSP